MAFLNGTNMTAEEKAEFRKEWKKVCDRLNNSGYDLSKIEIVPTGSHKRNQFEMYDANPFGISFEEMDQEMLKLEEPADE